MGTYSAQEIGEMWVDAPVRRADCSISWDSAFLTSSRAINILI